MSVLTNVELAVIVILVAVIAGMLFSAFKDDKEFF